MNTWEDPQAEKLEILSLQRSSLQREPLVFPLTDPLPTQLYSRATCVYPRGCFSQGALPTTLVLQQPALQALGCNQSLSLAQLQAGDHPHRLPLSGLVTELVTRKQEDAFVATAALTSHVMRKKVPWRQLYERKRPPLSRLSLDLNMWSSSHSVAVVLRTGGFHSGLRNILSPAQTPGSGAKSKNAQIPV